MTIFIYTVKIDCDLWIIGLSVKFKANLSCECAKLNMLLVHVTEQTRLFDVFTQNGICIFNLLF